MDAQSSVSEFKGIQPLEYFQQHIENGIRVDGRRSLHDFRPVTISQGTISSADGSAVIKQGNSVFVCGIKLELAPPNPNEQNKGFIVANVDLPPLCHSQFKPGPPSEQAQVASKFVKEVLENSGIVKLEDLNIKEGKLSWVVNVDIMCLNHDGNVLDCALKALLMAFTDLTLPEVTLQEDDEAVVETGGKIVVNNEKRSKLTLHSKPIACSMAIFDEKILVDPTEQEEALAESLVTVVLDANSGDLVHFYKPGGSSISRQKMQECTGLAKKQYKTIAKSIDQAGVVTKMDSKQSK
ncbi:hypothetical protein TCAL_04901 [Tigriopus californicus]|uniref:Ribosomal RNA-processing protein 43 n=1 Tax=Tigriopus californicus TaxID=6832 RepID=A0A553NEG6_TIGCA|nr:exosome complex component RRP43-like [Tigriopus californicus]TRY63837.1 hypothetical protein TCAL_04901 [Tigriopus californicus]|eukprot:TCALIF_04901-PA protein Name:"Similar to EXOSC8 Exosome complex component RRP43 (Bos taurus)" AED:0.05 eAED:0.05 QI:13/1/0.5/1/1/1/2/0/294